MSTATAATFSSSAASAARRRSGKPVVAPLRERGFRVIRFDQRGIGASTRGAGAVDIDRLAQDSLAVLEHAGSARALLLGHSTGGVILQAMALAEPARIAGVVLSGSWLRPNRYMAELFRSRLAILRIAPREYAAMVAFLGYPADWLEANWPRYEAMLAAAPMTPVQQDVVAERIEAILRFDRSGEVGRIALPVLIQGAEDDLIVPAFLQREQARAFPGATVHMFRTGGHFFPVTRTRSSLRCWSGSPPASAECPPSPAGREVRSSGRCSRRRSGS